LEGARTRTVIAKLDSNRQEHQPRRRIRGKQTPQESGREETTDSNFAGKMRTPRVEGGSTIRDQYNVPVEVISALANKQREMKKQLQYSPR